MEERRSVCTIDGHVKWHIPLQKTGESPQKIKIEACDLAISIPGIYPKEMKSRSQRNFYTPIFIAALFTIGKIWKQLQCPRKDDVIYILYI